MVNNKILFVSVIVGVPILGFLIPIIGVSCYVFAFLVRIIVKYYKKACFNAQVERAINKHQSNDIDLNDTLINLNEVNRSDTNELLEMKNNVSSSLAFEAYRKFGRRSMSRANQLVTRKWMDKRISIYEEEHGKLKTRDICYILDRAIYLSYITDTIDFNDMTSHKSYINATPSEY